MTIQETSQIVADLLRQRRYRELCDWIGRMVRERPADVGSMRISLANLLALGCDWETVRALLPPDTNVLETSGWLNSMANGKPVDRDGNPIPWFTYPAIDFITQVVRREWSVFEWGSGHSTLWWAKRVRTVTSVEDNRGWYDSVRARIPGNVTLSWQGEADDYVRTICANGQAFDVVVIDGSHRNECAGIVTDCVAPSGLIVFDNTDMSCHRDGVEILERNGWSRIDFYGLIPSYFYKNATSVFYRDPASLRPSVWPGGLVSCVGPTCDQALCAARDQAARKSVLRPSC